MASHAKVDLRAGPSRFVETRGGTPRILLVNPTYPESFWSFGFATDILGESGTSIVNLALPTLAALTPEHVDVRLVDQNVEEVDLDADCDVVGITGYVTQHDGMIELAREFRRRGRLVVLGGPYASLSTETLRPFADVMFVGEAEDTWGEFLQDYSRGAVKTEYAAREAAALDRSPAPRLDLVESSRYGLGVLQTSRGCPFACEFCDVIVYLGRRQRHKSSAQIVAELDNLYAAGYRRVFLSDDNFTANLREARRIVGAIAEWNAARPRPVSFFTQLSIEVARDRNLELVRACVDAGLDLIFIGIESADEDALLSVRKKQNTHADLVESVAFFARAGMQVMAGMITGFDTDGGDSFDHQFQFAQLAGIPLISVSILNAPEGTPLAHRLEAEGRIRPTTTSRDFYFATNLVPLRMTSEQLVAGTRWLANRLYQPEAFLERMRVLAGLLPPQPAAPPVRTLHEGVGLWKRVRTSFEALGPEFASLPSQAARLFQRAKPSHAVWALIYYRNVVGLYRAQGVWDPRFVACATVDEAVELDRERASTSTTIGPAGWRRREKVTLPEAADGGRV